MSCRRKIDSKLSFDYTAMESEVRTLKQELTRTRDALKLATKRCRELVRQLDSVTVCHSSDRAIRDQQLSKILRALLILESRLRHEQKSIRQQLCEKDNVIKNQQLEIAKLRRYTKNYIKTKGFCESPSTPVTPPPRHDMDETHFSTGALADDIQTLKREIITKFDCGVRKTDSFAGSDVSKESLTSENTDGSIVTTTTDGSPSLISTEGFCEGESTDVSPGSTLNTRRNNNSQFENDTRTVLSRLSNLEDTNVDFPRRRVGVIRSEPLVIFHNRETKMARSDSKDDGMDCNFISEDEGEPIYVNCHENNARNLREAFVDDNHNNNNNNNNNNSNNNHNGRSKLDPSDKSSLEDTSGNWYSDPDEDRPPDDILRHGSYRPPSNHNSVLECVNQILLRDMEDEETGLSISRKFKHRGRIVSFQPARLSDIESVGSEMERRNSEDVSQEKDALNFSPAPSETEFSLKIHDSHQSGTSPSETRAIPILIIEPQTPEKPPSPKPPSPNSSPIRLERIEEKTCLSMSSKGLTLAKNLDYEDIESLPEIPQKTPPALPPKPQFQNNTLILKKIPSPSFLIDETRKKGEAPIYIRKFFGITPKPPISRALNFDKNSEKIEKKNGESGKVREIKLLDDCNEARVTNIVKHFEEFKIGESERRERKLQVEIEEMDIRQNFEEFNLDDCDLSDDPDRPEGDGSERLIGGQKRESEVKGEFNGQSGIYDHFLEATGLSTKSILTPSRLLSNHKSMLKPKDVKYKSMIKAGGGEKGQNIVQTQVRHWTGPFV